jgi:D-alanyl-D-alanine carboxypeptidase (penicillin-binding protein 5/6)
MKRITSIFIILIMILLNAPVYAAAKANEPSVSADGAILMDADTGEILYSKNMNTPYHPASTTKIMTALLTLENCKLDDVVTVGKNPPLADGSKIYLFEGEQVTVKDLLYGLLLPSANDCAEALAEHISGSKENFAALMNKRAKELGCENTNFVNPNGLYDDNHVTSAKDLALIMKELSKHKDYTTIATTQSYKIAPTNKSALERPLWNENKLIQKYSCYYYPYCVGGKTGYTIQSAHSYVSVAEKDGHKLIVVLMHDETMLSFPDAINLFNYGYNNYEYVNVFPKDALVANYKNSNTDIPLLAEKDFFYTKEKDTNPKIEVKLSDKNLSGKYFSKGDTVTTADIYMDSKKIGTLNLKSGADHKLSILIASNKYYLPGALAAASLVIFSLFALFMIRKRNRNKKIRGRYLS